MHPPCVTFLVLALAALPDGANDYLTADGKLRERLEIMEVREGRGGSTGTLYRVQTDGTWSVWTMSQRDGSWQGSVRARGRLTDAQLTRLAEALARHQLSTLREHGMPQVNARTVAVRYGARVATLWPGLDERAAQTDAAVRARFAGVLTTVKSLCRH
jgi:hypothetical protein